jgi:2TM domain-containing protein
MEAESSLRDQAVARLKRKREFRNHLFVFFAVNVLLWLIWALSDDRGFPWPLFVTVFWGLGTAMQGWNVYRGQRGFSEQEIQEEVRRIQGGG